MARKLAPLVCRGQAANHGVDKRKLGGSEALLRAGYEHDGAEQVIVRDQRADYRASKAEITERRRSRIRVALERIENQDAAPITLEPGDDRGNSRARDRRIDHARRGLEC